MLVSLINTPKSIPKSSYDKKKSAKNMKEKDMERNRREIEEMEG